MQGISVIVPVHNTYNYLQGTVNSILAQTMQDFEIILCENCSTDGSYELCDQIAGTDPRIRVLHLDKGDVSHARNCGIRAASRDVLAFLDSDDTIAPEMFSTMYEAMQKYGKDIVSSTFRLISGEECIYPYNNDGTTICLSREDAIYEILIEKNIPHSMCTMLFRRHLFEQCMVMEDRYFEDSATTYRIVASSNGMTHISTAFYNYFQRDGSITHINDVRYMRDYALSYIEKMTWMSAYLKGAKFRAARKHIEMQLFNIFRRACTLSTSPDGAEIEDLREMIISLFRKGLFRKFRSVTTVFRIRYFWKAYLQSRRNMAASRRA